MKTRRQAPSERMRRNKDQLTIQSKQPNVSLGCFDWMVSWSLFLLITLLLVRSTACEAAWKCRSFLCGGSDHLWCRWGLLTWCVLLRANQARRRLFMKAEGVNWWTARCRSWVCREVLRAIRVSAVIFICSFVLFNLLKQVNSARSDARMRSWSQICADLVCWLKKVLKLLVRS